MGAQTLTFSPVTPEQVQKLLGKLRATGSQIVTQPDGGYAISGHAPLGVIVASAVYADPTLTVTVTKHGWNPMHEIESTIREHLESAT